VRSPPRSWKRWPTRYWARTGSASRDDQWALLPQDDSKPRRDASSRSWALDRCGVLTRQERYVNGAQH
jgi:hypothetical protein